MKKTKSLILGGFELVIMLFVGWHFLSGNCSVTDWNVMGCKNYTTEAFIPGIILLILAVINITLIKKSFSRVLNINLVDYNSQFLPPDIIF